MSTYRERREARADRLREWAEKREAKAAAVFESNRPFTEDYAFNTQPGHIPLRARIIAQEDRAHESLRKAQRMASRARGIDAQLAGSIYSDDHDAVEKLTERIVGLEAERDRIKAYNTSCRRGTPDPSLLDSRQQRDIARALQVCAYQCKGGAFPSYHLTNLTANITRNRKRLEALQEGEHAMTTEVTAAPNVQAGSFFESNWGYDQTNIDFYRVLSVSPSGKTARVQQWSSVAVEGDRVVPGAGPATTAKWVDGQYVGQQDAPVLTKRLRSWGSQPVFTVTDYANAYLWDGQAAYQTPIGAGH